MGGSVTPALLSRLRRITRAIVELPFYSDGDLHYLDVGMSWVPLSVDSVVDTVRRTHVLAEADQALLNRELAPVTVRSLWRQRMRWAQGWFQVSLRHGHATVKKSGLSWRTKLGIFILLGWREVLPWAAALMWPTLLFVLWRENGLPAYEPLLALITLLTLASGPI